MTRSPRLLGLVLMLVTSPLQAALELWVSPGGSGPGDGSRESPYGSLAAALRQARELRRLQDPRAAEGVHLVLLDGRHDLADTVRIRPEDSGTPSHPLVIRAAPGAQPVLSGGVALEGWERPSGSNRRLPPAAQSQVWSAPVPIVRGRPLEFRQLWVNGRKATRARTPNDPALARLTGWDRREKTATLPGSLLAGTVEPDGLELVVQQQWEIANLRVRTLTHAGTDAVLSFHEPESGLEFEHPWPQPILPPEGGGACFLVNAPEFLDQPGEWHLDRATGRVLYWPREDEDLGSAKVIAPALETLLRIEGSPERPVGHVQLQGVAFAHSTWLRPAEAGHVPLQAGLYLLEAYSLRPKGTPDWRSLDNQAWVGRPPAAVEIRHGHDVAVQGCRFEHVAMNALDLVEGVHDTIVEGSRFHDIGGNALLVGNFQTEAEETHLPYLPTDERELCRRVRIADNRVTDAANEDWGCVGIGVGYAQEVTIEHNEISHVSYTAISVGWGWTRTLNVARNHVVQANHLHHYATRMCDTAGVYTLSAQPGTVIRRNAVHSVTMAPYVDRPDHWFYLYLDEGSSFIQVHDNWTPEERFFENAVGPGNVWSNNGPSVDPSVRAEAGPRPEFRARWAE